MTQTIFSPDPVRKGRCQDCGWVRPVARVTFWATGYRMTLCGSCRRPYRGRLNRYPTP